MSLNLGKCIICFSRKFVSSPCSYILCGTGQSVVKEMNDLGVLLDGKLSFHCHYYTIISKGRKMLGCVKRWSTDFSDVRV